MGTKEREGEKVISYFYSFVKYERWGEKEKRWANEREFVTRRGKKGRKGYLPILFFSDHLSLHLCCFCKKRSCNINAEPHLNCSRQH